MLAPFVSMRKRMRTAALCVVLALLAPAAGLWPDAGAAVDSNADGHDDQWYAAVGGGVFVVQSDRDHDGRIDYEVRYDSRNRKISEQMDFNYDGAMDDFYFYEEGRLVRQEIDTNFDGAIDVWVFLDGVYVLGYERDKDFDGEVDLVKRFDG